MAKKSVMRVEFFLAILVVALLFGFPFAKGKDLRSYPLPQRILLMPTPEQIVGSLKTTDYGVIIYAEKPLSLEGLGTYTVGGYLKASKPLNSVIAVYRRTKDPARDPNCKAVTAPSQSSVYVCERGQSDVLAWMAEFANTKFASFCFSSPATIGVNGRSVLFWIGVGWDPFLPHPLTLLFDNLTAININLRFLLRFPPCDPSSWW